jgi:hypothetical protein
VGTAISNYDDNCAITALVPTTASPYSVEITRTEFILHYRAVRTVGAASHLHIRLLFE